MIASLLLAVVVQTAAPGAEAEMLGRQLARNGTLATLLPLMTAKETDEIVAAHPELSAADKAELRGFAEDMARANIDRLLSIEGHAYATALSLGDLRVLVAASEEGAAKRQRAALPKVIAGTMTAAGPIDFKGEVLASFCKATGKACPAK